MGSDPITEFLRYACKVEGIAFSGFYVPFEVRFVRFGVAFHQGHDRAAVGDDDDVLLRLNERPYGAFEAVTHAFRELGFAFTTWEGGFAARVDVALVRSAVRGVRVLVDFLPAHVFERAEVHLHEFRDDDELRRSALCVFGHTFRLP